MVPAQPFSLMPTCVDTASLACQSSSQEDELQLDRPQTASELTNQHADKHGEVRTDHDVQCAVAAQPMECIEYALSGRARNECRCSALLSMRSSTLQAARGPCFRCSARKMQAGR